MVKEFHNGETYYKLHGSKLHLPRKPELKPKLEFITWHNVNSRDTILNYQTGEIRNPQKRPCKARDYSYNIRGPGRGHPSTLLRINWKLCNLKDFIKSEGERMRQFKYILIIVLLWSMGACSRNDSGETVDLTSDGKEIAASNTAFAFDLYKQLSAKEGNLIFSPYSISTALSMTLAGARGESAKQMQKVLHLTQEQPKVHAGFKNLIDNLNGRQKKGKYELNTANALWTLMDLDFKKEFIDTLKTKYNAEGRDLTSKDLEEARQTINAWVEKQTKGKIKDLIPKGILTKDTFLVLTNAIYFKGKWAIEFEKENTSEGEFTLASGEKVKVPMMFEDGYYKYFHEKSFAALELPYKNKELSMVIFLPDKYDGLPELEKLLTAADLNRWLKKMKSIDLAVSLPKFKMTYQFLMTDTLKAMGIIDIFSEEKADLSGTIDVSQVKGPVYVQAVVHKAFIDVNEEGTEAAAAAGVVEEEKSEPLCFYAHHPFVFMIRDNLSGSILFMGRVMDPR